MSEQTLISAFSRWRNRLLRQALRFLPSKEDAEDVLQDAFIRLWAKAEQIETERDAASLATVVIRNMAVDHYRQQKRKPQTTDVEMLDLQEETADMDERRQLVDEIMQRVLTPLQLRIVELREYEGLGYDEVASILGMQQPAVRMQLSRARRAIREEYVRVNNQKKDDLLIGK
ncbi:MAG: sigma-70 family RNA polymerase sigma factor [Bacteroidaceae bacterium]|nr:sigma-70 family RNA polymerase sigma factor [Bacteroidaceae bacterium]